MQKIKRPIKKCIYWGLPMIVLVAITWWSIRTIKPNVRRVTVQNFRLIHVGMTDKEVERILGKPGYKKKGIVLISMADDKFGSGYRTEWREKGCVIHLHFYRDDENGGTLTTKYGFIVSDEGPDFMLAQRPKTIIAKFLESFRY